LVPFAQTYPETQVQVALTELELTAFVMLEQLTKHVFVALSQENPWTHVQVWFTAVELSEWGTAEQEKLQDKEVFCQTNPGEHEQVLLTLGAEVVLEMLEQLRTQLREDAFHE
jgi:hypothetical protein